MSLTRQSEGRLPRNTLDISGATLTGLNGFMRSWVWCCHMIQWQNTEIGVVSSFFQSCHMSSLINLFALEKLDFVIYMEARLPRQQIWSSLMLSYDKHSSFNCSAQHWILSYLKDFWEPHKACFQVVFFSSFMLELILFFVPRLFLPMVGFFVYAFIFYI